MSRLAKALEKLRAKPTPPDITWDELKSILERLGYKLLNGSGSRRKFHHKDKDLLIICHEPHPGPNVDRGCIADVAEHLEMNGFFE